jgi:hypothetical protein
MNTFFLDFRLYALMTSSVFNYQVREVMRQRLMNSEKYKGFSQLMINLIQSIALSSILLTAETMFFPNRKFSVIIPIVMSLTTSGLTYVAYGIGYSSQNLELIHENLGSFMNLIGRISSVFILILLAPHASKAPLIFGLAGTFVALNIMDSMTK